MEQNEKITIVELLRKFVTKKGSQNKASTALKVSSAVVSHLLSGNWSPYSDDIFRKIGAQVGHNSLEWKFANTSNSERLLEQLENAKDSSKLMTIIAPAGSGKSEITKKFTEENENTFRIECGQYWDPYFFLNSILQQMNIVSNSQKPAYMLEEIFDNILKLEDPQIIIDEIDKVDDKVLAYLITFYNKLFKKCSIVILATNYLVKRINDGVRLQKKGYNEIKSRFGRYYEFEQTTAKDVRIMCETQGITDSETIEDISRKSRGDFRIVRDLIEEILEDETKKMIA
ncbi:ATP-binding protein [Epilithonimonas xixisoli]|uniref:AAA domain-containing protein n=1 Tax=Epilithonimonas xixisoli TaxID=1476462 RepID=A0A4R8ICU7_9FLAO|nr:ATP-binding protein [Epilithonimonas xixisoli]TDX86216.1 AAA domain-containing protein [Epilithonimonas xixisoli]